jgi:hypothetical protein
VTVLSLVNVAGPPAKSRTPLRLTRTIRFIIFINGRNWTASVQSGVRRLVLLSGRGDEEALLSEQARQDSGADRTILRSSWFCQNFSEDFPLEGERSIDIFLRSCGDLPMSEKETTRKAVGRRPEHLSVFERFRRWSEAASASYKSPRTRCAVDIRDRKSVRRVQSES